MAVTERHLTAEQFLRMPKDGRKYEFVNGEVSEVPTGGRHGEATMAVTEVLILAGLRHVGIMFDSSTGFTMSNGNVRCPDVSFMVSGRLPGGIPPQGFVEGAPDLCVEVISPSEDQRDSWIKIGEYFESGAQQVWHVFPEKRRIVIHRSMDDVSTYTEADIVEGGALLPGLTFKVGDVLKG